MEKTLKSAVKHGDSQFLSSVCSVFTLSRGQSYEIHIKTSDRGRARTNRGFTLSPCEPSRGYVSAGNGTCIASETVTVANSEPEMRLLC
jgi:hypothetical protein